MDIAGDPAGKPDRREALLAAVEEDLARIVPGAEIVDRGLDLSRSSVRGGAGRRADLVVVDSSGRPFLVLLVDGRGDDTLLAAIHALVFARQSGDALSRPGRAARARVVIVAESFSARTLESLALFSERELSLLEARPIESARGSQGGSQGGSQVRLVSVGPIPARGFGASDRATFLAAVPETLRTTVDLLLRKLARVDAGIAWSFGAREASFRCGNLGGAWDSCLLEIEGGALFGVIPALDRRLPIRGSDDADAFLDEVLREHIRLLGPSWSEIRTEAPDAPDARGAGEAGRAFRREPLLTPEEIEAFRA